MTEESPGKKGIKAEMLVGVSAVFIGLCALAVSLYETQLMREEQRSSVLPILELGRSYYTTDGTPDSLRLKYHAENVGIGPALVRNFRVTVDGEAYPTWQAAIRALLDLDENVGYGQSTINGRTIPPDRIIEMFDLNDSAIAAEIIRETDRLNFEACYCSVFDECWTTNYADGFASSTPVPACEINDQSFLE